MALRLTGGLAEGLRLLVELRLAGCHPPLAERERRGDKEPLLGDEGRYREPSLNKPCLQQLLCSLQKAALLSQHACQMMTESLRYHKTFV